MKKHQEMHSDGTTMGRDPRQMTADELLDCGVEQRNRAAAIRAKCLDCCCYQTAEVRRCGFIDCALWPYRMGGDPFRKPMSDEAREAARQRLQQSKDQSPLPAK